MSTNVQNDPLDLLINLSLTAKVAEAVVPVPETLPAARVAEVRERVRIAQKLAVARTEIPFEPLGLSDYIRQLAYSIGQSLTPWLKGYPDAGDPSPWVRLAKAMDMTIEDIRLHLRVGFHLNYGQQASSTALHRGDSRGSSLDWKNADEARQALDRVEETYREELLSQLGTLLSEIE